jgi:hypothetical protein
MAPGKNHYEELDKISTLLYNNVIANTNVYWRVPLLVVAVLAPLSAHAATSKSFILDGRVKSGVTAAHSSLTSNSFTIARTADSKTQSTANSAAKSSTQLAPTTHESVVSKGGGRRSNSRGGGGRGGVASSTNSFAVSSAIAAQASPLSDADESEMQRRKVEPSRVSRAVRVRVLDPKDDEALLISLADRAERSLVTTLPLTIEESVVAVRDSWQRKDMQALMRFQDSWHRPGATAFLGAEIAEAYNGTVFLPMKDLRTGTVGTSLLFGQASLAMLIAFIVGSLYVVVVTVRPQVRQTCLSAVCLIEQTIIPAHLPAVKLRLLLRLSLLALSLWTLFWLSADRVMAASTPLTQIYEGYLLDSSGNAITTAHAVRLSYWSNADHISSDTTGSGTINTGAVSYAGWQEEHTVTPNSNGYFSVEMGSVTALPAVDAFSIGILQNLYLQVEVKTEAGPVTSYEILDPSVDDAVDRLPLLSVPFALNADMLDQRSTGTASGSIPVLQTGGLLPTSTIPSGLALDSFTIDSDDSSSSPTLRFGTALAKTLQYSSSAFRFNDDVVIVGDLSVSETLSGASAVTFSALKSCSHIVTDGNGQLSCGGFAVRKSVDETLTGSTVLQNDDELFFSVGANETWTYSFDIVGQSNSGPAFAFAVAAPAGSMCVYAVNAENSANGSAHTTCGEASNKMAGTGDDRPYFVSGTVVTGDTAGSIVLQWAQNSSNRNKTIIRAGSFLRASKVP